MGYRSGQPGQTVNLLAYAFGGSNPSPTTRICSRPVKIRRELFSAGIAQLARASAFQAEGRGFEPRFPLHNQRVCDGLRTRFFQVASFLRS